MPQYFCAPIAQANKKSFRQKIAAPETAKQPLKKSENKTILFLEQRIKRDPEDYIAYNKLASEYLQQMRETGDINYLNLATRAAKTSLEILPAHQNKEGLAVLALVKYSSHEFAESRDHAKQLIELEPNKGFAYQILGDALLELGDYRRSGKSIRQNDFARRHSAFDAIGDGAEIGAIWLCSKAIMIKRKIII